MHRILMVEDDAGIAAPLKRALEREGFEVTHADHGAQAIALAGNGDIDLVLLDLTLPDIDGLDVCRRLRADRATLPIVMLTARSEEVDLVVGFDAGADDYVTKPFSMAELTARVRARLRLATPEERTIQHGPVRIDLDAHVVTIDGTEITLTPKEFELLVLLASEAGRVVPRQRIMGEVWAEGWFGTTRALDVHMSALRKKLDDPPENPRFISTVRGVGFRFELQSD